MTRSDSNSLKLEMLRGIRETLRSVQQIVRVYQGEELLGKLTETISSFEISKKDMECLTRCIDSRGRYMNITFCQIVEKSDFSASIIVLREGGRIPLHDHPGMYGVIKPLCGSLRIKAFCPINETLSFRKVVDDVFDVSDPVQIVTPWSQNIHEVQWAAGSPFAAFFDVLTPSYDADIGCKYFAAKPKSDGTYDLVETSCPNDYMTDFIKLKVPA